MKWIGAVFLFLQVVIVNADTIDFPTDEKIITGELSNGLTYYVRPNAYPQKTAALRLVVEVGSLYEKDDEKGLAHFVEHMVFRGSKNFSDEESIKYLESIGAWYGADTNAATGFESTRYELNIPLEKEEVLEKSLLILSDFAAYATFPEEPMEAERGVILNELHQRTGNASWKVFEKEFNYWTQGSNYENHFPIGLPEIVKTVSAEKLREFYRRWYRPDRMAVIAVGDFDPEKVVLMIEKLFGDIPCPEEEVEEPSLEINFKPHSGALIHHDPELTSTDVSLFSFQKESEDDDDFTIEEVKSSMISHLTMTLLDMRLNKLSDLHPAPVVNAGADEFPFSPLYSGMVIDASLFENRWKEGIKALHDEIRRASALGFTAVEWKKLKNQLLRNMNSELENLDKCEHDEFVADCIDNFLEGDVFVDPEWSLRFSLKIIEDISIDDINGTKKPWEDAEHWTIIFSTPSREIIDEISPDFLLASLEYDENLELLPLIERELPETISEREPHDGHITEYVQDDELGVTHLTLSNGIKVVLKPSDIEKSFLQIFAVAENGYASLPQDSYFSAKFAVPYFYHSGLGNLASDQLFDYLETEGIGFYLGISNNSRSIVLSSRDRNQEKPFELLHALFTVPKFDRAVWDGLLDHTQEVIKERLNDPETAFDDFTWQFNTQNHFLFKPLDLEKAEAPDSQKVFEKMFGNPADFTFIVVGDFESKEMESLAIEYLASIPVKTTEALPSVKLPTLFPSVAVHTEFKLGSLPHARTVVSVPFDFDGAWEHFGTNYYIHAAKEILEQRLTEVLRKKMGNTYHVGVSIAVPFSPSYENSMLQIGFSCPHAEIQKMVQSLFSEIAKLKEMPPAEEEVATVRELFRSDKKINEQTNNYWISMINISEVFDVPLNELINFEDRISSITPSTVYEAFQYLFASPYYTVLSHVPE